MWAWFAAKFMIFLKNAAIAGALYGSSRLFSKGSSGGRDPASWQPPAADPDRPIPVVWGTCKVQPNVFWWGDAESKAFTYQGIHSGYTYYAGVAMSVCWGPVDAIEDIIFDNTRSLKDAVTQGLATCSEDFPILPPIGGGPVTVNVDSQQLFGGPQKEGGIRGKFDIYFGTEAQTYSQYVQDRVSEEYLSPYTVPSPWLPPPEDPMNNPNDDTISDYKRLCYVVFHRTNQDQIGGHDAPFYWGVTPQIKSVHVVVRRCPSTLTGDGLVGTLDANAAEAVYEVLTDDWWGYGIDPVDIDADSFEAAADTLEAEGMGISWTEYDSHAGWNTIDEILRHVDGVRFQHPHTGLQTLNLVRGDYNPDDLIVASESNSTDLQFERPSYDDIATSVRITWTNRAAGYKEEAFEWQNQATLEIMQDEARQEFDFSGLADFTTAALVAGRAGRAMTIPFAKARLTMNRHAHSLTKGGVFMLSYPTKGIGPMVMRILGIDYGSLEDGRIDITAMQDVFLGGDELSQTYASNEAPNRIVGDPSIYPTAFTPEDTYSDGQLQFGRMATAGVGFNGFQGSGANAFGGAAMAGSGTVGP